MSYRVSTQVELTARDFASFEEYRRLRRELGTTLDADADGFARDGGDVAGLLVIVGNEDVHALLSPTGRNRIKNALQAVAK